MNASETFRTNLKAICHKRDINQRELARLAGVHYVYLNRVFQGNAIPTITIADKLARAAGCDLKKIFSESR